MKDEERHVASLVFTEALPADADLLIQTLEESEFIRVEREGAHFADIVIEEADE